MSIEDEIDALMLSNSQLKARQDLGQGVFEERLNNNLQILALQQAQLRLTTDFLSGWVRFWRLLTMDLNDKAISENIGSFPQVANIRSTLAKAIFLNVIMQFLQIIVALFSMVVYNKILPNYALPSLYTLVTGIGLVVLFDFILKWLKARLVNEAGDRTQNYKPNCLKRFLAGTWSPVQN